MKDEDFHKLDDKGKEFELKRRELEKNYAEMFIDFAKFGFSGTRKGSLVGMVLIAFIATLDAFTTFDLDSWVYAFISANICLVAVIYGYLSLFVIPKFGVSFMDKLKLDVTN